MRKKALHKPQMSSTQKSYRATYRSTNVFLESCASCPPDVYLSIEEGCCDESPRQVVREWRQYRRALRASKGPQNVAGRVPHVGAN